MSAATLKNKRVNIESIAGVFFCENEEENIDHLFCDCPYAKTIWVWILRWRGIVVKVDFSKVKEILNFVSNWGNYPKQKNILLGICYGILWDVWNV